MVFHLFCSFKALEEEFTRQRVEQEHFYSGSYVPATPGRTSSVSSHNEHHPTNSLPRTTRATAI